MSRTSRFSTGLALAAGGLLMFSTGHVAQADGDKHKASGSVTLHFGYDSTELSAEAKTQLDELAAWVKASPDRQAILVSPSDAARDDAYGVNVASTRATAAKDYLVKQGVAEYRINIVEDMPVEQTNARIVKLHEMPEGSAVSSYDQPIAPTPGTPTETVPAPESSSAAPDRSVIVNINPQDQEQLADAPPPPPPSTTTVIAPQPTEVEVDDDRPDHLLTPAGLSFRVGGGVMNFLDDDTKAFTDAAGTWEARLTYGTRSPIGVEAAYVGSAQNVDALGLDSDAVLLGTMGEAALRFNIPLVTVVQPYAFAGLGVTRYDIVNSDQNTSNVDGEEIAYHVPVGAGIGFAASGFLFDIRGTVRPMFEDALLSPDEGTPDDIDDIDADPGPAGLDSWAASANVGIEF